MKLRVWRLVCCVALSAAFSSVVHAQQDSETVKQLWPEVDIYVPLNEKFRLFFLATTTKSEETKDNLEAQVGAHIDYHLHGRSLYGPDTVMASLWQAAIRSKNTESSLSKRCDNRCHSIWWSVIVTVRTSAG